MNIKSHYCSMQTQIHPQHLINFQFTSSDARILKIVNPINKDPTNSFWTKSRNLSRWTKKRNSHFRTKSERKFSNFWLIKLLLVCEDLLNWYISRKTVIYKSTHLMVRLVLSVYINIAQEHIEIRAIFRFWNIAAGLEKRGQKLAFWTT